MGISENCLGRYGLQTASKVKSDLRFGFSELDFLHIRRHSEIQGPHSNFFISLQITLILEIYLQCPDEVSSDLVHLPGNPGGV